MKIGIFFGGKWDYYGKIYNLLAFNDGYHQEHHLKPMAHWCNFQKVYQMDQAEPTQICYVRSSIPAILGFLDKKRSFLHHRHSHAQQS